jgi:hypothetical protein
VDVQPVRTDTVQQAGAQEHEYWQRRRPRCDVLPAGSVSGHPPAIPKLDGFFRQGWGQTRDESAPRLGGHDHVLRIGVPATSKRHEIVWNLPVGRRAPTMWSRPQHTSWGSRIGARIEHEAIPPCAERARIRVLVHCRPAFGATQMVVAPSLVI